MNLIKKKLCVSLLFNATPHVGDVSALISRFISIDGAKASAVHRLIDICPSSGDPTMHIHIVVSSEMTLQSVALCTNM
jgi:hypothetical protein